MITPDVLIECPLWGSCETPEEIVCRAVHLALNKSGVQLSPEAELCVLLTNDESIQALNKEWRGFDKPTNVLSFPRATPQTLAEASHLGDIAIAYETVMREARDENKPFEHHLSHLVVHGILHLLGHDHEDDTEATAMESLEVQILAGLGIKNPYEET